jgi:UDP-N-acetyl-D-mannosaminuronate dehydrogenase
VELTPETVAAADCVMIVTDHTSVDYRMIKRQAKLVVDTRNALPKEI